VEDIEALDIRESINNKVALLENRLMPGTSALD
jgi:hypothetical protein